MEFITKDSGQREEYDTGMVRDTQEGKARFSFLRPEGVPYKAQFLTRCAELMTRGAEKYGARNWEKAHTQEELDRFRDSAERHMNQWLAGETDEDHAAAVFFNLMAAITVEWKMKQKAAGPFALQGPFLPVEFVRVVPYHGHSHNDIEQVRMDARSPEHLGYPPHKHDGGAIYPAALNDLILSETNHVIVE